MNQEWEAARVIYLRDGDVAITFPFNRWVVNEFKRRIPSSCRAYDPYDEEWLIASGWDQAALRILEAAFREIEVQGLDAEPTSSRSQIDPDFAVLHIAPDAPREVVHAAYKALARLNHPDNGGDAEAMRRINASFESLRKRGAA